MLLLHSIGETQQHNERAAWSNKGQGPVGHLTAKDAQRPFLRVHHHPAGYILQEDGVLCTSGTALLQGCKGAFHDFIQCGNGTLASRLRQGQEAL